MARKKRNRDIVLARIIKIDLKIKAKIRFKYIEKK